MCLEAVKKSPALIRHVPKKFKTFELLKYAVRVYTPTVPKSLITEDLCLEIVKYMPFNVDQIPKRFQTRQVYLEACRTNGYALQYIDP